MFLSIIIPIYNDEKYLNACLDSCLDQDYPKDDYEIICVDDESTDRTPEILREYAEKYSNIRLIFIKHIGSGGRAVGFQEAQGDYIWFVDHDDIVAPNAVKDLAKAAKENSEFDRIEFPCYEFFYDLEPKEREMMQRGTLQANGGPTVHLFYVWSSIIKKAFIEANQISPRSKRIELAREYWGIPLLDVWGGDNVFMEECFDKGMKTFSLEGRPLYHYRRHDNSESMALSKSSIEKRYLLRYNTAMVRAYNAMMLKESYLKERAESGCAAEGTTVRMVVKLRHAVSSLAILPAKYWREGLALMKKKGAFFRAKPEEYHYPFASYIKSFSFKYRFLPRNIVSYYLFTLTGARIFRVLGFLNRRAADDVFLTEIHRMKKRKKLIMKGTAKSKSA